MKYKVLLCGKSKSIIDDFFAHLELDFEVQTTSLRYADFMSHLRYYEPDAVVFCIHKEAANAVNSMVAFMSELEHRKIPLIIIGNIIECEEFQRATYYMAKLILKKPMRIHKIGEKILEFLEQSKYKNADENIKMEESIPAFEERIPQLEINDEITQVETVENIPQEEKTEETSQEEKPAEISQEEKREEASPKEKSEEVPPEKKRVLVVDDDPMMLRLIKEQIKDTYAVATAINGNIALKFLESKKTDMVILDYEMPNENGADVLKKIRDNEATSNLPVVFLTGISDREKIQNVLSFKPQGYLLKPIEREKLLEIIANTIG